MATRRPPPPASSVVRRKRSGEQQVRKTVYFLPKTAERLDRYAFEHRRRVWEVVEQAVADFLDSEAARERIPTPTTAPPSAPVKARKRSATAADSTKSVPPNAAPTSRRRAGTSSSSIPPSTQPSHRPTTRPPRKKHS